MRVHYKYTITWVIRGMNPKIWSEKLTLTKSGLIEPDAVKSEALSVLESREGPWTQIDILEIHASRVEEQDAYVVKPIIESEPIQAFFDKFRS